MAKVKCGDCGSTDIIAHGNKMENSKLSKKAKKIISKGGYTIFSCLEIAMMRLEFFKTKSTYSIV